MKSKTTMKYLLTPVRMIIIKKSRQAGEGVEKRELLCTVGRNVNWCSAKDSRMEIPQKLKIRLLYDPAISLLGVYPKKTKRLTQKAMSTHAHCSIIYNSQDMETI